MYQIQMEYHKRTVNSSDNKEAYEMSEKVVQTAGREQLGEFPYWRS